MEKGGGRNETRVKKEGRERIEGIKRETVMERERKGGREDGRRARKGVV